MPAALLATNLAEKIETQEAQIETLVATLHTWEGRA